MVDAVKFSNRLDVYWDKVFGLNEKLNYKIFVDGEFVADSDKTFYYLTNLKSEREYNVTVKYVYKNGTIHHEENAIFKTLKIKKRINVTEAPYFAKGDGVTLNTAAIQNALNALGTEEELYFPAGTYVSGALTIKPDTSIYLEKDATLQGSAFRKDYLPKIPSRFEGLDCECYSALINAGTMDSVGGFNTQNITIYGEGKIIGGGLKLYDDILSYERVALKEYMDSLGEDIKTYENNDTIPGRTRPCLISIYNAQNIVVSGLEIGFGPAWNLHYTYCENVKINNCRFYSKGVWNGDGIDPDSSENSVIFDCAFDMQDDAVAIKSGRNPDGNRVNRPTKNVKIFNICGCHSVSIGSEMSGGVENVYIWDCNFVNTAGGVGVKSTRKRGGYVKNIFVSGVICPNISIRKVNFNNDGEGYHRPPYMENFYYEDITLTGFVIRQSGLPDEEDVINICGFEEEEFHVKNVTFKNVKVKDYPSKKNHFIRVENVTNLTIENFSRV